MEASEPAAAAAVDGEDGSGRKGSWYAVEKRAVLVPYLREHVPLYHEWMQVGPRCRTRRCWRPPRRSSSPSPRSSTSTAPGPSTPSVLLMRPPRRSISFFSLPRFGAMVGDVNIYMNDPDDLQLAEIEIMIAEQKSRGKGLGKEVILMMMAFAVEKYRIHTFKAKISESNTASLKLFRKLGFNDASYSAVFKEVTLEAPAAALPLSSPLTIGSW